MSLNEHDLSVLKRNNPEQDATHIDQNEILYYVASDKSIYWFTEAGMVKKNIDQNLLMLLTEQT